MPPFLPSRPTPLDVPALKADFPIFSRPTPSGHPLTYLDSAATSQKPLSVLDAERDFYLFHNAAAHRSSYFLAEEATTLYESARATLASFLHAPPEEVVFTSSATAGLNLLAYALSNASSSPLYSSLALSPGDEVLVTEMEHHANLLPWQLLCERTGATLRWITLTPDGHLDLSDLASLISERTRVVALTHQSNLLGTRNVLPRITSLAHDQGALVILDAAQSAPHLALDVRTLDVDALVFSGHKMLGPTGIGVLWARYELLDALPPFLSGGSMIEVVSMDSATFAPPPQRFEAGVPMMAQAVGLAAAVDYLSALGMDRIEAHEEALTSYALSTLSDLPGLHLLGPLDTLDRGGLVSFTLDGVHPHDVGQVLDSYGVAIRTGHHCAWPAHRRLGLLASSRASFYLYNSLEDVDTLANALLSATEVFA